MQVCLFPPHAKTEKIIDMIFGKYTIFIENWTKEEVLFLLNPLFDENGNLDYSFFLKLMSDVKDKVTRNIIKVEGRIIEKKCNKCLFDRILDALIKIGEITERPSKKKGYFQVCRQSSGKDFYPCVYFLEEHLYQYSLYFSDKRRAIALKRVIEKIETKTAYKKRVRSNTKNIVIIRFSARYPLGKVVPEKGTKQNSFFIDKFYISCKLTL